MSPEENKALELILLFMPHCKSPEDARECAKKCIFEIKLSEPTMPRRIHDNDDEFPEDAKNEKYLHIAQSKDFWEGVMEAIDMEKP